MRVEIDDRSEKIGYKIREAQLEKVPYMIVAGDKDIEEQHYFCPAPLRRDLGSMTLAAFVEKAVSEIDSKEIK